MKVFQINSVCGTGSTGRIALDLKHFLEQNGVACKVAYGRGFCEEENCVKISTQYAFLAHTALSRLTDRQGFYSKKATKRLIQEIEQFSPDIIHLHNIHGYYLNIQQLFEFLKHYGRPVVWTLHDCWAFTGHCAYYSYAACEKWKTGCKGCPQKKEYPASLLLDRSAKNYRQKKELFTAVPNLHLITPSEWLAGEVQNSFLGKCDIQVIPNGIDLNVFRPTEGNFKEKYGLTDKKIVLGVANIWERRKGLDDFIALSPLLPPDYKIVLVGLSEKQLSTLPQNIIGITRTDNVKQLAEIYTAAEVYVNPTYEDNYPTTNLEAIACGTPVITYQTGGSPESAKVGKVVEQGDIKGLKAAIMVAKKVPFDPKAIAFLDKEYCYQLYDQLYESLISAE